MEFPRETRFAAPFRLGPWVVHPDRNELSSPSGVRKLERMTMQLLILLVRNAPRTTTREEVIQSLWQGRVVSDEAVTKQISKLRVVLESHDDGKGLLQTVAKVGVRLSTEARPLDQVVAVRSGTPSRARYAYAAAPAAIVALLVLIVATRQQHIPAAFVLQDSPVTSIPGWETDPALSPDGRTLAYSARAPGEPHFSLFVRKLAEETGRRISTATEDERAAAWSADGRLAYVARSGDRCSIVVADPKGGMQSRFVCVAADQGRLDWSGSDFLVVSDRTSPGTSFRLWSLSLKDGRRNALTSPPPGSVGDLRPIADSDNRLVFLRMNTVGLADVYERRASGEIRRLSYDNAQIFDVARGPDTTLLVSSNRDDGIPALWRLQVDDRHWQKLAPLAPTRMSSAADGRTVVYNKSSIEVTLWRLPLGGGMGQPIAPSTSADWSPALAPDGRRLAYLSERSGTWEAWIADLSTGTSRRLTHFAGPVVQDLAWSPDGRTLAMSIAANGQFDVTLVNSATGAWSRATTSQQDERQAVFSRDGREIFFVRRQDQRYRVYAKNLATGAERWLFDGAMRVLPDTSGKLIYFVRPFVSGLLVFDPRNGSRRMIASWPDVVGSRNFTVADGAVWGVMGGGGEPARLQRYDEASGREAFVTLLPGLNRRSGIAIAQNAAIYARAKDEESDLRELVLK